MMAKRFSKNKIIETIFGCLFGIIGMFAGVNLALENPVYAEPGDEDFAEVVEEDEGVEGGEEITSEEAVSEEGTSEETVSEEAATENDETKDAINSKRAQSVCENKLESVGWLVCPTTGKIAEAVDWLYEKIENILVINPVEIKDGSPIYEVWKYIRGVTNIVFMIFLLVVVYSQITGVGISNYGIKKALPKLIVAAILVNLSFMVCSLAVDASNVVGSSLRGVFTSIEESTIGSMDIGSGQSMYVSMAQVYSALAGGSTLAIGGAVIAIESGAIWMLIPVVLGAIVAVVAGLITIALRQAVVVLLIMVAPLAIVAYILPNTEEWFTKWRKLLVRMLVFYPVFSLLFGASSLAGFAIIASARDGFGVLVGIAVQIFPLFFSWSLMKMSGTVLGTINTKIRGLAGKPIASTRIWAESHRAQTRANMLANGVTPSARLMQYLEQRKVLRETDTKNALEVVNGRNTEYVQRKIAGSAIGEVVDSDSRRASRYTRTAKKAKNYSLISQNATAHAEHVLSEYGQYYNNHPIDKGLAQRSAKAWVDYGRSIYQKEIDEENDINFLVDRYLEANKRDANNRPVDEVAFSRYISSVTGPEGEERLLAKVVAQASKVESKQRAEFNVLYSKFGHNGYNKHEFRSFITGYLVDDDGWAIDARGHRIKFDDGTPVEIVPGDAITKAPEKLVLYTTRDEKGLYYDFKDQNGNVIARVHRGRGADGDNHDDAAFIKESLANLDIPIADPINNVYGILSGVKVGDVTTPQGENEIGLARYSTTIGRAMSAYKENAAWAGSMFNSGIGNRQISNSAQYAIWVLDSFKKTLKPGAFNRQNPASVEFVNAILDPDNWSKIFTEEEIRDAVNINNEPFGGEDWELSEDGRTVIGYTKVDNPNYEQRMNTLKRKLLFPAMKKILPSFDRLRTSNTADNQKPGTADAQYDFLKMVEEKWENNDAIQFDPMLVDQDLQSEALAFRQRKHDKHGNLIYGSHSDDDNGTPNLLNLLEDAYNQSMIVDDLKRNVFEVLNSDEKYRRALERFEELCNENPYATMSQVYDWFTELDILV